MKASPTDLSNDWPGRGFLNGPFDTWLREPVDPGSRRGQFADELPASVWLILLDRSTSWLSQTATGIIRRSCFPSPKLCAGE